MSSPSPVKLPIDARTIEHLNNTLDRLKKEGSIDSNVSHLWLGTTLQTFKFAESPLLPASTAATVAKDLLQQLKTSRAALRSLLDSLDVFIPLAQQQVLPSILRYGVAELPNEVLARVFSHYARGAPERVITLSHVSRRFREVTMRNPSLWANITCGWDALTSTQVVQFLKRSMYAQLNLKLQQEIADDEWSAYLSAIRKHSGRWHSLVVRGWSADDLADRLESLRDLKCNLPVLKSLSIDLPTVNDICCDFGFLDVEGDAEDSRKSRQSHSFYKAWKMPSLRCLISVNHLPHPCIGSTLSFCELDLSGHEVDPPGSIVNADRLLSFLGACRSLSHLVLSLNDAPLKGDMFHPANLYALDYFELSILSRENIPGPSYKGFMSSLFARSLIRMELSLKLNTRSSKDPDYRSWLDALLVPAQVAGNLMILTVNVTLNRFKEQVTVETILDKLPGSPNILLEISGMGRHTFRGSNPLATLLPNPTFKGENHN